MSAQSLLFWVFALAAAAGAIAVVVSQNIVRMAFWLIVSLGSTAGLFFLLNADFVGTAQLLVYVGGTLVLLIFGVMLTASGPFISMKTSPGEGVMAGLVGLSLLGLILYSVCAVPWEKVVTPAHEAVASGFNKPQEGNSTRQLGFSLLGLRPDTDLTKGDEGTSHTTPGVGYLLPFEIASVHLLVVLVGAAYLARTKRRKEIPEVPVSAA
jgi:NADH:ubiquinone oxidoreductase subunit 6 (subunit J)